MSKNQRSICAMNKLAPLHVDLGNFRKSPHGGAFCHTKIVGSHDKWGLMKKVSYHLSMYSVSYILKQKPPKFVPSKGSKCCLRRKCQIGMRTIIHIDWHRMYLKSKIIPDLDISKMLRKMLDLSLRCDTGNIREPINYSFLFQPSAWNISGVGRSSNMKRQVILGMTNQQVVNRWFGFLASPYERDST